MQAKRRVYPYGSESSPMALTGRHSVAGEMDFGENDVFSQNDNFEISKILKSICSRCSAAPPLAGIALAKRTAYIHI